MSYVNSPPFCHEWQKASNSSSHLVVEDTIIVLVLRCLWRRRVRRHEATKMSLPSGNTANTGVHLTWLITKCVKASIHALQLHHDHLEGHTTRRWRRSGGSRRSHCLCPWPLRSKLGITSPNGSSVYGTYMREVCRLWIGDRKMVENLLDSQRENELITGHCIPIYIYKR